LLVASSDAKHHGVTSACQSAFDQLRSSHSCLWFDMNDISSADNLFEVVLEACYSKLGVQHWTPPYIEGTSRDRAYQIRNLCEGSTLPWIIFLNARETPGANVAGDTTMQIDNGWLDTDCAERTKFIDLLRHLCGPESPRLSVTLLCYGDRDAPIISSLINQKVVEVGQFLTLRGGDKFDPAQSARAIVKWANDPLEKEGRRCFLQQLVYLQRSRLLATIWHLGVPNLTPDGDRWADHKLGWLDKLEELDLIRWKIGGFIWMHSPIRQAVRTLLEQGAPEVLQDWHPNETLESTHYHLAAWYVKVLDATRSPSPIFEATYHLCRAAAAAKEQEDAARHLYRASSMLKTNAFEIQTRGFSRGSCRRLEQIKQMGLSLWKDDDTRSELKKSIAHLVVVCSEVMRAIAREVGEDGKAYQRHREAMAAIVNLLPYRDELHRERLTVEWNRKKEELREQSQQWLRGRRWLGMLALHSRSFKIGEQNFSKGLQEFFLKGPFSFELEQFDRRFPENAACQLREALLSMTRPLRNTGAALGSVKSVSSQSAESRIEILRTLEEGIALLLLRSGARRRLIDICSKAHKLDPKPIQKAQGLAHVAIDLANTIIASDDTAERMLAARANWCKSRLLVHLSHCLLEGQAAPAWNENNISYQPALSVLGDAEACLRVSTPYRYKADLMLVELNRAEVRLREAASIGIAIKGEIKPFACLCRELSTKTIHLKRTSGNEFASDCQEHTSSFRTEYFGKEFACVRDQMARARSLLRDALRFLDRAEPVLRERRKNVWWTTWYIERRMRAISYYLWSSALDHSEPIPFLGQEVAMDGSSSEPDTLLESAVRTIRNDSYRLASIILAYASCARALDLRLLWDPSVDQTMWRLTHMQEQARWASKELEDVDRRRLGVDDVRDLPDRYVRLFTRVAQKEIATILNVIDWRRAARSSILIASPR
jgi:hypothetical protein